MDGNRRWAKKQGLAAVRGHAQGVDIIKKVIIFCLKKNISYVSLYTFSTENFKRSEYEKTFLFRLLSNELLKGTEDFIRQGVQVRFVGDSSLFPKKLKDTIKDIEEKTKHLKKLQLNFLFCYGGRQEIVDSVKTIVQKVKSGQLSEHDISEETVSQHLWCNCCPDPELIVRTGGAQRLSNFLLFQAAYSEFFFLDCFWPEVTELHLDKVYKDFEQRKKNFGT